MKKEEKENPLQKYLDDKGLTMSDFSRVCKLSLSSIHAICHGRKMFRSTAVKIVKATKKEVSLEDLGL
jgi:predicted transcriptional regulator